VTCDGVLWVGGGIASDEDRTWTVIAYCDGGTGGSCGYIQELEEWRGEQAWGIASEEMDDLQKLHLAHSRRPS